jgi:hypothetical protein
MKNISIKNLGKVVPKQVRLRVYKSTLAFISKDFKYKVFTNKPESTDGLCMLLPAMLWGLEDYKQSSPSGRNWSYEDTSLAFPELTKEVIQDINSSENKVEYRKKVLNKFILTLTNNKDEKVHN